MHRDHGVRTIPGPRSLPTSTPVGTTIKPLLAEPAIPCRGLRRMQAVSSGRCDRCCEAVGGELLRFRKDFEEWNPISVWISVGAWAPPVSPPGFTKCDDKTNRVFEGHLQKEC